MHKLRLLLLALSFVVAACSTPNEPPPVATPDASITISDGGLSSASFVVAGTVTGLLGSGLVLDNGGELLSVGTDGPFAFSKKLSIGNTYDVVVKVSPSTPAQTCSVAGGSGTVSTQTKSAVVITCETRAFRVGGTVTGMAGSGLVLQNNGADNLPVDANGKFTFPTLVRSGELYTISIGTQPTSPSQACRVSGGAGTVIDGEVASVTINCDTNTYTIGGSVDGLLGVGLVLQNNSGDSLIVNAKGAFAFASPVPSGAAFAVTILAQPSAPSQMCVVENGTGSTAESNVTNVSVRCGARKVKLGGTVSGLSGTGLVLRNEGTDDLAISANGSFAFATPLSSSAAFDVTIAIEPAQPRQHCVVSHGSGVAADADITNVTVVCLGSSYSVSGTVIGLSGSGLLLQNNGGDDLPVRAGGNFMFHTPLVSGTPFAVTVAAQPSNPVQNCVVSGGSGEIGSADVTGVVVNCLANSYTIGGTISGLLGAGLVLQNEGGDNLPVNANGTFSFATPQALGSAFAVSILSQPTGPRQTCAVTQATGSVPSSNVMSIDVSCTTNRYSIGGQVRGLRGSGLVLHDTLGGDLAVSADGPFALPSQVDSGKPYTVTVQAQPQIPTQTCSVDRSSGVLASADITNVSITCTTQTYAVSGTISGLASTVVLVDNGGDPLNVGANGTFTFATALESGSTYAISVQTQPSSPKQICTVSGGTGTVSSSSPGGVAVQCVTQAYTIGGTISGLAGAGLVLQDNGGESLPVNANGTFTFSTSVKSGSAYAVTVSTQPGSPAQSCTVSGGAGTVTSGNVTTVSVNCGTNTFTVGGTVAGLSGAGLQLVNNGGVPLPISSNGTFSFPIPLAAGSSYAVTAQAQPQGPSQTCVVTGGTGTVGSSNVVVGVQCTTNTFAIAVQITGLSGSGLMLQNNGGDNLAPVGDGTLTFSTRVASGQPYAVTVFSNPTGPSQTCVTSQGSGIVGGGDVTDVHVTCTTRTFTVGGTLSGLASVVVLRNNAIDPLTLTTNGAFTFSVPLASGSTYNVSVGAQPSSPTQTCTVSSGTGTLAGGAIGSVTVSCVTNAYSVGGQTSGLVGSGLVLQNSGGDNLAIVGSTFTFGTKVTSGASYHVTVLSQPSSPPQTCVVGSGSGTITSASVSNVSITCTLNNPPADSGGAPPDGPPPPDGGPPSDGAAPPNDGGPPSDGGPPPDGAKPSDASADTSAPTDASAVDTGAGEAAASDGGCTLTANTSTAQDGGQAPVNGGCTLPFRDTSSCRAGRVAQGLSGFWLNFSCRVALSVVSASGTSYVQLISDSEPDYKTNYFATTDACYSASMAQVQNPNLISTMSMTMRVPLLASPGGSTSVDKGVIGLALNGVAMLSNNAAPGDDIYLEAVSFDKCQGHPNVTSTYHYHSEPYSITYDDSNFVGVMLDGYPLYGRRDYVAGSTGTMPTLDSMGGHTSTTVDSPALPVYHYHVNLQTSTSSTSAGDTEWFLTTGTFYKGVRGTCTGTGC